MHGLEIISKARKRNKKGYSLLPRFQTAGTRLLQEQAQSRANSARCSAVSKKGGVRALQ